MNPAWRRLLKKHQGKTLVQFCRRPKIEERIAGFVMDFSDELILLHRLDWNTFSLDGYTILRDQDIQQHRFFNRQSYWQSKAIRQLKIQPQFPQGMVLANLTEAIRSLAAKGSLIHVEREGKYPDACWIGLSLEVHKTHLVLDNLDPNAKWTGAYRIKLVDITRIDFGGGYEQALALTAPSRKQKRK